LFQVKIGDMNVSKLLKNQMNSTQTGTPFYASPEVWKDERYGLKADVWSLGCVVYEMCALKPPF
jgi:NIMA (never in mitosis gene a)-related kinase